MNQNKIVLEEISKGLDREIQSIEAVKSHIENAAMQAVVEKQESDYQRSLLKAHVLAKDLDNRQNSSKAIEAAFLKSIMKMKTLTNDSDEHIAKALVQKSNRWMTNLNKMKNRYVNHTDVFGYIENLLENEQKHIDALKPFL